MQNMTNSFQPFSKCIAGKTKKINERVIAFLFFRAEATDIPEASPKEINQDFIDAGLGSPNTTRLRKFLVKDKWRLKADKHEQIAELFGDCLSTKKVALTATDSVIPSQIMPTNPKYLLEVCKQINGCYDIDYY